MGFWTSFYSECLQEPWWVPRTEPSIAIASPPAPHVFVVSAQRSQAEGEMLQKMIKALHWKEGKDIVIVADSEKLWSEVPLWSEARALLIFDRHEGPGGWGQLKNWEGHQLMRTHSLKSMQEKPELKRETWKHLQEFAEV